VSRIVLSGEPLIDGATALRPWREADLAAIVAACQDREISRWTRVPFPYGQEDARAFLLARHDAIHAGTMAPFAIVMSAEDTQLLGSISLMDIDWDHRRAQVGYWLARQARGHGHATRAVGLICRWGFDALGLERIELLAATQNRASQRVAERAGFTREALLRSHMPTREGRRDMIAYGLLATDAPGGLLRAS
jgi:RimJ/RimL family protein N-acetyltransferase